MRFECPHKMVHVKWARPCFLNLPFRYSFQHLYYAGPLKLWNSTSPFRKRIVLATKTHHTYATECRVEAACTQSSAFPSMLNDIEKKFDKPALKWQKKKFSDESLCIYLEKKKPKKNRTRYGSIGKSGKEGISERLGISAWSHVSGSHLWCIYRAQCGQMW